jgi:RIO kinase 1
MSARTRVPHDLSQHPDSTARLDVDPLFDVAYHAYDDPDDDQRWSTWHSVEPLCRGPEPRPDW